MDLHSAVPGLVRHRRGEHEVLERGGCQQGITLVLGCACTPLQLLSRRVGRKRQEQPAGAQRGSSARVERAAGSEQMQSLGARTNLLID